jgi:hypothetical protein
MSRRRPVILWSLAGCGLLLVCCGGPATVVKALLNDATDDFKNRGEHESWSVAEARRRGVLVADLEAVPAEVEVAAGGRVRVREAWVEERARSTHRLIWLPTEERVGGYRLHLTFDEGEDFVGRSARMAGREDAPEIDLGGHVLSDGRHLYVVPLDDPDVSGLRLILARKFDDPRGKEVRFVPKAAR